MTALPLLSLEGVGRSFADGGRFPHVQSRTALQQQPDDLLLPVVLGEQDRALAQLVAGVQKVRFGIQDLPDPGGFSGAHCVKQRLVVFHSHFPP